MITYNFRLQRFQDSNGKIRSNLSGLLSSSARKTLDPYKNKKEPYKTTLDRLQIGIPHQTVAGNKASKKSIIVAKKGKIYEVGIADDWSTDYDYVTTEELESALYGYDPVEGSEIFKRMRHRKKHRTPGKFMYNTPSELRKKYSHVVVFMQLRTTSKNGNQVWMLPLDFSMHKPQNLKQIYERIQRRTTPVSDREKNAAKKHRRQKNLSWIERTTNFIIPSINSSNGLKTGTRTHWYLDRVVGFLANDIEIDR